MHTYLYVNVTIRFCVRNAVAVSPDIEMALPSVTMSTNGVCA